MRVPGMKRKGERETGLELGGIPWEIDIYDLNLHYIYLDTYPSMIL